MPAFDVTIQGKTYHVDIPDPAAVPLVLSVDGQVFEVDIAGLSPSPVRPVLAAEPVRRATEPPSLPAAPVRTAPRTAELVRASGSNQTLAPMPGTILSIEVEVGAEVGAGDVLCVLEAMKMKNPIRAGHAGTVAEIAVSVGQTVSHGDLLVRLA